MGFLNNLVDRLLDWLLPQWFTLSFEFDAAEAWLSDDELADDLWAAHRNVAAVDPFPPCPAVAPGGAAHGTSRLFASDEQWLAWLRAHFT